MAIRDGRALAFGKGAAAERPVTSEFRKPRGKMKRAALTVISALFAGILCLGNASAKAPESCHGDLIRVHLGSFGGAGGQEGQAVVLTNRAHSACAVSGFPEFSAFTAAGSKVPVRFVTHTYLGGHPVKVVRLDPGKSASILYDWQDVPSNQPGGGCVEVVKIAVGLRHELGPEGSWTLRTRDDVCQGMISVLSFTAGSDPTGFGS
jgi:hypothetical protein